VDAVAIIGVGASGVAAARLATAKGAKTYVSDLRADAGAAAGADRIRALGADVDLGRHDLERIVRADAVVVSPGIPPDAAVLQSLRARGVRWISEPEFAFRFFAGPLIAVTGTNGKTTTAALTAHLLKEAGVDAALGGNVGGGIAPAASELALREPAPDWYVLEMSSFQLADIERFRPDIGVVTNLAPDHLDRYATVAEYYADKARLFENADADSRWVLNGDDPEAQALPGDAPGARYLFSTARTDTAARIEGGTLTLDVGAGAEPLLPRARLPLLGEHNASNALAAALAARLAGAEPELLAVGLARARPLAHRLEPVAEAGGVLWVNDSKATNVAAALSAVRSLDDRRLVVLLGGKDKGEDFAPLARALVDRARVAITYGAAGERIAAVLDAQAIPVLRVTPGTPFEDVVEAARERARAGDVVLLTPACSSFDMFADYEERGRSFAALARARTGRADRGRA
jgi:UDP-N-acetylmuramoylalanine--D-glutamate ligase